MARAFLIGAGATRAQYPDAPLSADFFNKLRTYDDGKLLHLYKYFNEILKQYIDRPLVECNVEDLMIQSREFIDSIRVGFIDTIHTAIFELLAEPTRSTPGHMQAYLDGKVTPNLEPTLFRTLLLDDRLSSEDFFITLNYDLYLDREILKAFGKIDYGLREGQNWWDGSGLKVASIQHYSVYHLHGSLNWVMHGDDVRTDLGAIQPEKRKDGANWCLILPGEKKELNVVLQSIWKRAEDRLLDADELIIIGCSLNPLDTELLEMLGKYKEKNGPASIKLIFFDKVETYPSTETYHNDLFGKEVKQYPFGFSLVGPLPGVNAIEYIFENIYLNL